MAIASSFLWIIGFALSVTLGPTLKIWTWAPTMLCFAVAAAIALPKGTGNIDISHPFFWSSFILVGNWL
jgi:CHAT domain-containing protein